MDIKDDYYCYIESNGSFLKGVAICKIVYEVISNIQCKDVQWWFTKCNIEESTMDQMYA